MRVDSAAEEPGCRRIEVGDRAEGSVASERRIRSNDEVEVAPFVRSASCDGAEDTEISQAQSLAQSDQLGAPISDYRRNPEPASIAGRAPRVPSGRLAVRASGRPGGAG